MESMGYSTQVCLRGTGISLAQLADADSRMTLAQELAFYRNTLELSGDPAIGLKLGELFLPQRYGLFGYALLSAATFRHALTLTQKFGQLTFSFFTFSYGFSGGRAWFAMGDPPPFEQALVDLYLDRDMSAAIVDFGEIVGQPFRPLEVHLSHDGHGRRQVYEKYFGCELCFGREAGRFVFPSSLLDEPLPQSDPESSSQLQQQCQVLIGKLSKHGRFVDHVRMLILSRPGYFPDIDYVAEKLGMSVRTLRRRLQVQDSSYRSLLDEIRYGLAQEYLGTTGLPMEEIATLLGYTEPGNFTHAFRRWSGTSPTAWRKARVGTEQVVEIGVLHSSKHAKQKM
jgi:AraC-like DNA-binding protein